MANPYQRGTDLKHCPDGCEWLRVSDGADSKNLYKNCFWTTIDCIVGELDTCPREQEEKPAVPCSSLRCGGCDTTDTCETEERLRDLCEDAISDLLSASRQLERLRILIGNEPITIGKLLPPHGSLKPGEPLPETVETYITIGGLSAEDMAYYENALAAHRKERTNG